MNPILYSVKLNVLCIRLDNLANEEKPSSVEPFAFTCWATFINLSFFRRIESELVENRQKAWGIHCSSLSYEVPAVTTPALSSTVNRDVGIRSLSGIPIVPKQLITNT